MRPRGLVTFECFNFLVICYAQNFMLYYLTLSYDNVKLLFCVQTLHLAMDDDMLKIDGEFTDVSPHDSSSAETSFDFITRFCT